VKAVLVGRARRQPAVAVLLGATRPPTVLMRAVLLRAVLLQPALV